MPLSRASCFTGLLLVYMVHTFSSRRTIESYCCLEFHLFCYLYSFFHVSRIYFQKFSSLLYCKFDNISLNISTGLFKHLSLQHILNLDTKKSLASQSCVWIKKFVPCKYLVRVSGKLRKKMFFIFFIRHLLIYLSKYSRCIFPCVLHMGEKVWYVFIPCVFHLSRRWNDWFKTLNSIL